VTTTSSAAVLFVLTRALVYSALFIGLLLVALPARVLFWSGITPPAVVGPVEAIGIVVAVLGGALAVWCILTFVFVGRGTPAPMDPPRRLVVAGPYRWVRNPMYLGAGVALSGAALFYRSTEVLAYALLFLVVMHLFAVLYEEPTLEGLFGDEYRAYRRTVGRWLPRIESRRRAR
jgi:protein-S-isoprenylcysteine O-methyltransferase Ste14